MSVVEQSSVLHRPRSDLGTRFDDGVVPGDPKDPLRAALDYIAACQSAHPGQRGHIFTRLATRAECLAARLDAEPRPERDPATALNRRAPHKTMLTEPLANAAVPVKFERKRRGRPPKTQARKRRAAGAR